MIKEIRVLQCEYKEKPALQIASKKYRQIKSIQLIPTSPSANEKISIEDVDSFPMIETESNIDDITRYYRSDLIKHLLNCPLTQIECEFNHLLNEQNRVRTYQSISLRTQIYCLRLRLRLESIHRLILRPLTEIKQIRVEEPTGSVVFRKFHGSGIPVERIRLIPTETDSRVEFMEYTALGIIDLGIHCVLFN
ncbi:hypothetical protein I4U23_027768 [Adineta vaga]|nr:hypothetical protein I4U23_027768 [Adineta vaga]